MISNSQSVHGFRQSIKNYNTLPSNWIDDLFWLLRCFFSHSKCTSMYSYIFDKTYGES